MNGECLLPVLEPGDGIPSIYTINFGYFPIFSDGMRLMYASFMVPVSRKTDQGGYYGLFYNFSCFLSVEGSTPSGVTCQGAGQTGRAECHAPCGDSAVK